MDGMIKAAILTGVGGAGLGFMTDGTFDLNMAQEMVQPYIHQMEATYQYVSQNGLDDLEKLMSQLQESKK